MINNKNYKRIYGLVTGKSNQGKSFLVENYMIPILTLTKPVLLLDPNGNYQVPGMLEFSGFLPFYEHVRKKKKLLNKCYMIHPTTKADSINFLGFCLVIGGISMVIEEAHQLYSRTMKKYTEDNLMLLANAGRHRELDTIFVTQVPYQIPRSVRTQMDFITSFHMKEPTDINYLKEYDAEFATVLPDLPQYEYYTAGKVPDIFPELKSNEIAKL